MDASGQLPLSLASLDAHPRTGHVYEMSKLAVDGSIYQIWLDGGVFILQQREQIQHFRALEIALRACTGVFFAAMVIAYEIGKVVSPLAVTDQFCYVPHGNYQLYSGKHSEHKV